MSWDYFSDKSFWSQFPTAKISLVGNCQMPTPLIETLVQRGERLFNVEIVLCPTPYAEERWSGHYMLRALFVVENVRQAANTGRASYNTPIF